AATVTLLPVRPASAVPFSYTTIDIGFVNGRNDAGAIVGTAFDGSGGFVRDAAGNVTYINAPGANPGTTQAFGINDHGGIALSAVFPGGPRGPGIEKGFVRSAAGSFDAI